MGQEKGRGKGKVSDRLSHFAKPCWQSDKAGVICLSGQNSGRARSERSCYHIVSLLATEYYSYVT